MHPRTKATLRIALRNSWGRITPSAVLHELYPALEEPLVRILGHLQEEDHFYVDLDAAPARWKVHALAEKLWLDYIELDADGKTTRIGPKAHDTQLLTVVPSGRYAGQPFANPQPQPLTANTADFRDKGDSIALSTLGVFAIDRGPHKLRRSEERAALLKIEGAYRYLQLDRKVEENRIASQIATDGTWPRSTGLFGARLAALDEHVTERARRLGYVW